MARMLSGRIHVSGELVAAEPLHVGSGHDDVDTDMAVAVDGQGRVYAPGTGLAGALRHWCTRRFETDLVDRVFGFQRMTKGNNNAPTEQGHAAYLFVEDAPVLDQDGHPIEIRDHVGIDRQWGVAAEGIKFDRAVLPKGAKLDLQLRLDLPSDAEKAAQAKALLGHLLQALVDGQIRLGAAKTRGLGRVRLTECDRSIREESWDRTGIIARLRGELPARSIDDMKKASGTLTPRACPRLRVTIDWHPIGPVMVKAGVDGLRVDTLPLLGGIDGQRTPLIPGSSLKGVLRTHAERILRTLLQRDDPQPWYGTPSDRWRFLAQLDEDLPLIQELFGSRGRLRPKQAERGQGALSAADCFAHNPAPSHAWNRMFFEPRDDDEKREQDAFILAKAMTRRTAWQKSSHVAIDRWTGGSAAHLLYTVLEPLGEAWPAFELELDVDRIGRGSDGNEAPGADQVRTQAWVLLLLVLRDLSKNRIPIGFGGNRGLGEIEVDKITIEPLGGTVSGITSQIELLGGDLSRLDRTLKKPWQDEWTNLMDSLVAATASEPNHV